MTTSERIVADGQERLLTNSKVRAELEEVVSEIEASYEPGLEATGFLSKSACIKSSRGYRRSVSKS